MWIFPILYNKHLTLFIIKIDKEKAIISQFGQQTRKMQWNQINMQSQLFGMGGKWNLNCLWAACNLVHQCQCWVIKMNTGKNWVIKIVLVQCRFLTLRSGRLFWLWFSGYIHVGVSAWSGRAYVINFIQEWRISRPLSSLSFTMCLKIRPKHNQPKWMGLSIILYQLPKTTSTLHISIFLIWCFLYGHCLSHTPFSWPLS